MSRYALCCTLCNIWIYWTVEAFLPTTKLSFRSVRSWLLQRASNTPIIPNVPMDDRFDRWRLLQNILDEEYEEEQVEALVDIVVTAASGSVVADLSQYRSNIIGLERLYLPDPEEDKDAFNSLWDTVSELHGREGVKMDLKDSPRWPYLCCLCRILLHNDFLTEGIAEGKQITTIDDSVLEEAPHHDP